MDEARITRGGPAPLGRVAAWALAGAAVLLLAVVWDVGRTGGGNPVSLVQPGADGEPAEVFSADFPGTDLPDYSGHDGQLFYAIARQPMHWSALESQLDRPRYRLQRPLLPWLAWAAHPTGGGTGLIAALLLVNLGAVVAGGVALGMISVRFGGPPWLGALFALLPGTYAAVRISTADALAVALALVAVALSLSGRRWPAVIVGVAAVLAKEPALLLLAGFSLWRRDRDGLLLTGVPAAVGGGLALWLRLAVPENGAGIGEFGLPLTGVARAASRWWAEGQEAWGLVAVVLAVLIAGLALWRTRWRGPFTAVIVIQLAFVTLMGRDVIGLNLGGTRATLPLLAFALLALAVRGPVPPAGVTIQR